MFFFRDNKKKSLDLNRLNVRRPNFCEFENEYTFFMDKTRFNNDDSSTFVILYECMSCNRFIAIEYSMSGYVIKYDYNFLKSDWPFDQNCTNNLKQISSRFIKIYKQASIAEKMNLDELEKMSYRKSIEILINDYLKSIGHSENDLKNKFMKDKINLLPHNELFKESIPRLISWIGNDGTHPYPRHPELSLEDMKTLIYSFVICLSVISTNKKYSNLVEKNNKSK